MADGSIRRGLGATGMRVFPVALGGNVFGWTADEQASFAVLDAYFEAGGNFLDTADEYSCWAPGNDGGVSETIIGRWMAARRNRDEIVLVSKVGLRDGLKGLAADTIQTAIQGSLRRLGVESIDLYYAHRDDPTVPQAETMRALSGLVDSGQVRHLAASSFTGDRLQSALDISRRESLHAYAVMQPLYNLIERDQWEGSLSEVCAAHGIPAVPHSTLAQGFLAGKYRRGTVGTSPRAPEVRERYMTDHGFHVLSVVEAIAQRYDTSPAAVSLAWLMDQPNVVAPIASARSVDQLSAILAAVELELAPEDLERLSNAAAGNRRDGSTG